LGYSAAAIGNHELDYGPEGLRRMIEGAGESRIPLLLANVNFAPDDPSDDGLEALYGPQGQAGKAIHPYVVLSSPLGQRVGVFGLMGLDAAAVSNAAPLYFSRNMEEMAKTAQGIVHTLRDEHKVDLVIALAHLGVDRDAGGAYTGESIELARQVEGIDVLMSGHLHTVMDNATEVACEKEGSTWSTLVMEAGSYRKHLGEYTIQRRAGALSRSGRSVPITDQIASEASAAALLEGLKSDVEQNVLTQFPVQPAAGAFLDGALFQALTSSDFDILRYDFDNNNLTNLAADAMRDATGVQVAVASNGGDVRESLLRVGSGTFSVADTFIVTPLGNGPDQRIGYPLVRFYMTLFEMKLVLEATLCDAGLSSNDYMLGFSGMRVVYDSSQPPFARIRSIELYEQMDETGDVTTLFDVAQGGFSVDANSTLIHVCTSSYIAQFLASFNLTPKDASAQPVSSLSDIIARNPDGSEIKLWYVLQQRLAGFEPKVPLQYSDEGNPLGPYWRRAWDLARHPR
ncbi:MAG: 5'-nucleotidase C-terminal domain-containing protein, partial [Myxococcota bacterium]|nr:5'-nucleotidase C-terminal domain-containing protein [Myxococcota bacterium]